MFDILIRAGTGDKELEHDENSLRKESQSLIYRSIVWSNCLITHIHAIDLFLPSLARSCDRQRGHDAASHMDS